MHVVRMAQVGAADVLTPQQVPAPTPGRGDVLVKVTAAGVNFIDVYHRTGRYPQPLPFVPGVEGAGTVAALGAAVDGIAVGQRVAWVNVPGAYSEYAAVPADRIIPLPEKVGDELAAASLLQGITAHYLTHASYPVREGDTVLIHAAAGGTGQMLTQIAAIRGARVIGTVSTAEKEKVAREAGAAEVLRSDVDDLAAQVRALTGGSGVSAVYDGVGTATFEASLASLAVRGTLVYFGAASGLVPPFDLARLAQGSHTVIRPTLGHYIADRAEYVARATDVLDWLASGRLRVAITGRYPLAGAADAHRDLENRRTTGKLLLIP
jgi:NADPH2:quinone reductase